MATKYLFFLLILITTACNDSNESNQIFASEVIQKEQTSIENDSNESPDFGERIYLDSSHYKIIRRKFKNGKLYFESISDTNTKIDNQKEYYLNGHLKERGQMTSSSHHLIGTWEYYSSVGNLDSVVDFDSQQNISYTKAISIAEQQDFKMPDIEVNKWYNKGKMYWKISRWKPLQGDGGETAETILIDSETGTVNKPDFQEIAIY